MAVFADTFYWIALANPKDDAHPRVLEFSRTLGSSLIVTTDEVLTEFLAFCASYSQLRLAAAGAVQDILGAAHVRVIPQTRDSFLAGLELYRARPDKGYSLTDCISMQTMRREAISDVLTNDRHFQQEGFRVLFRDS
ncbi:MAG: PIN domain-containing protein [Candidatus Sulfotelmatobacter sp.]